MKTLIASALIATSAATASYAGACDVVDNIDKISSMKLTFMLNTGIVLVATGNPAIAITEGVLAAGVVGGILYAADGTCYVIDNKEEVAGYVVDKAESAYDYVMNIDYTPWN